MTELTPNDSELVSQDLSENQAPFLIAQVDNVRKVYNLLKAVNIKDRATIVINQKGLKIVVEEQGSLQAVAFLQSELFDKFEVNGGGDDLGISLNTLLECLNIFGSSATTNTAPALKLSYSGYGSPLVLLLTDHGISTDCSIKTLDPEIPADFDFRTEEIPNRTIFKAEAMKATLGELDSTSDVLEITMSPEEPCFRISTFGAAGTYHIDYRSDCEAVEMAQSTTRQSQKFKLSLLRSSLRVLGLASKVSFRMNARGFLSLHFLLEQDGLQSFVEYLCCPLENENNEYDE